MAAGRGGAPLLVARDVTKSYPGVRALQGVDVTIAAAEIHSLVGENGAGKSTLIKILAGVERRDGGTIEWDGRAVALGTPQASTTLGISVIHQDLNLAPNLSAAENILLGRSYPRRLGVLVDWRALRARARRACDLIGLDFDVRTPVRELGHAQRVLVAIARALTAEAKLIVMDEPTAALSASEITRLHELIGTLRDRGAAVLYVSHRLDEVIAISDSLTVLKDGSCVGTFPRSEITDTKQLARLIIGRIPETERSANRREPGEVVAEARSVSLGRVLENVSLSLREREIVGLAGLVGSGRSELASLLFGAVAATSGEVRIGGRRLRRPTPAKAMRHGVALVPEDRRHQGSISTMTVRENSTLASLSKYRIGPFVSRRKERRGVHALVDRFRIKISSIEEPIRQLSGGNQQKVIVARWADREPRVLLFDEPTQGIDVGAKTEVFSIMRDLANQGCAVLFISSEIEELVEVADRIAVLREGRLVAEFSGGTTSTDEILHACFGQFDGH